MDPRASDTTRDHCIKNCLLKYANIIRYLTLAPDHLRNHKTVHEYLKTFSFYKHFYKCLQHHHFEVQNLKTSRAPPLLDMTYLFQRE